MVDVKPSDSEPGTINEGAIDSVTDDNQVPDEEHISTRAGRGALWAVAATFTMRFASIAITAILAHILSKADFGVFAVALAVYLVVASLAELGMGSAIVRSAREPKDIAPTVTTISILTSGVIAVLMALLAPQLATVLGQPDAAEPIRILSLCLFLTGVFAVPGAQLVREFKQDKIFLATVVGFVVSNPLLIVLALNGGGASAFAWSRVVGQLATGIVFVLCISKRYRPGWRRSVVRSLVTFGVPLSLANLVNWSLLNADYLLLGRLATAAEIGAYMIAFNVASWSTAILGSVLNSIVVPVFGRVSESRTELARALVSASRLVALLAMPVGAMTLALSTPLILTIFRQKWADVPPVLAVLSIYGVLYAFTLLYVNVLVATGQTVRLLLIQVVWVATLVPAIYVGFNHSGLVGVAWAHVITIGLIAVPAYLIAVLIATRQKLLPLLTALARPALSAVLACIGAAIVAHLIPSNLIALIVGGLVGGIIYLLLAGKLLLASLPQRLLPGWIPARWRPEPETTVAT